MEDFWHSSIAILVPEKINKLITIYPGASLQKQKKSFFMKCLIGGLLGITREQYKPVNGLDVCKRKYD